MTAYLERLVQRGAGHARSELVTPAQRNGGYAQTDAPLAVVNTPGEQRSPVDRPSPPNPPPPEPLTPLPAVDRQAKPPVISESIKPPVATPLTEMSAIDSAKLQANTSRVAPSPEKPFKNQPQSRRSAEPMEPDQQPHEQPRPGRIKAEGQRPFIPYGNPANPEPAPQPLLKPSSRPTRPFSDSAPAPATPQGQSRESQLHASSRLLTPPPRAAQDSKRNLTFSDIEEVIDKAVDKKAHDLLRFLDPQRSRAERLEPHWPVTSPPRREPPKAIVRTEHVEVVRPPDGSARRMPRYSRPPSTGRTFHRSFSKLHFGLGQM